MRSIGTFSCSGLAEDCVAWIGTRGVEATCEPGFVRGLMCEISAGQGAEAAA